MRKRFIVVADTTTAEQDKAFQSWLKEQGLLWWHWLVETWLINDLSGAYSSEKIRDKAREFFPTVNLLVIELNNNGDRWSGFGPKNATDPKKNMFDWIHRNWDKKKS